MKLSLKRADGSERIEEVRTGQMMGSQLSFPLLCIVNYLAFRFSTMDETIPVKINGDDIVFRSTRSVAERWMESVSHAGLKLSKGKTLVDCSIFTLNSCLFSASQFSVKSLPFIRAKALFGTEEGYTSLPGRFKSFAPGFGTQRAFRLRSAFLRQNVGFISKSRRSLNRGLGMHVPLELLKLCRLWGREVDYLSLPKEKKPPPTKSMWEMQPEGYHIEHLEKKSNLNQEQQKELVNAVVSAAWKIPKVDMESYEVLYDGGINRPAMKYRRGAKLMGPLLGIYGAERIEDCQYGMLKKVVERFRSEIFSDYLRTAKRVYPTWVKDSTSEYASSFKGFVSEDGEPFSVRGIKIKDDPPSSADDEEANSTPVPPIDLGSTTVWDIAESTRVLEICEYEGSPLVVDEEVIEQTIRLVAPRNKLKVMKNGIGIGPPTCW